MENAIEVRGLAKTYRTGGIDVLALRGVDLEVAPGEFVAIMGSSGSGKSTLLHLAGGLDRPSAGEVRLADRRIDDLGETALSLIRRRQVGFVFQFFNLIPSLTVAENVELPALLAGRGRDAARARRRELLDAVGVTDRDGLSPAQLSGGQQQRVAIARALVNEPAVVMADEPTGNLDSANAADVLRLLRQAADGGQAVLMVTHEHRAAATADRIVTLEDGLLVDETSLSPARPAVPLVDLGRHS